MTETQSQRAHFFAEYFLPTGSGFNSSWFFDEENSAYLDTLFFETAYADMDDQGGYERDIPVKIEVAPDYSDFELCKPGVDWNECYHIIDYIELSIQNSLENFREIEKHIRKTEVSPEIYTDFLNMDCSYLKLTDAGYRKIGPELLPYDFHLIRKGPSEPMYVYQLNMKNYITMKSAFQMRGIVMEGSNFIHKDTGRRYGRMISWTYYRDLEKKWGGTQENIMETVRNMKDSTMQTVMI